ncbi:hypothetical protein CO659_03670 [Rhizobium sp. S9]|uniref:hypothetical protein n=1 Tax=Rhizobium sp. S9 TaxID=2035454 RepID=UPI000BEA72D8|nr:hypothetical protein [Rhizobium sp. S9]PDS99971.1 hypothetical protein CO659_03670 [Rhizobium sp. S9]
MTERTIESEITFSRPFALSALVATLDAGTYRVIVDEELIEGLSFPSYRRTAMHIEIPALGVSIGTRQLLQVHPQDLESAIKKDAEVRNSERPGDGI